MATPLNGTIRATPAAPMTTADEPDGAPRLAGLDVLRGIAILAILFLNISDMGASFYVTGAAVRSLGWTAADRIVWALREILAEGTARCLLEMLFGVGMVILTDRATRGLSEAPAAPAGWMAEAGRALFGSWPVMRAYYRRNLVLLAFGVVHLGLLMWPGDILHTYAIAAMVAFPFRRLSPPNLLALGLLLAGLELVGGGANLLLADGAGAHVARLRHEAAAGRPLGAGDRAILAAADDRARRRTADEADLRARRAQEDRDRAAATGSAASWIAAAERDNGYFYLGIGADTIEPAAIWEAVSAMLIGAALFRWGVIQGRRSRRFYLRLAMVGYGVGLAVRIGRTLAEMRFDDGADTWTGTYEAGRLAMTLGHLSLVWLLLGTALGARLLRPFAAAGRTALSLYVAQTLIALWLVFPPFALGLYGKLDWVELMLVAAAIDVVLLLLANWWLGRFAIAPVEWAWRSLIAGRRLPFRRTPLA